MSRLICLSIFPQTRPHTRIKYYEDSSGKNVGDVNTYLMTENRNLRTLLGKHLSSIKVKLLELFIHSLVFMHVLGRFSIFKREPPLITQQETKKFQFLITEIYLMT